MQSAGPDILGAGIHLFGNRGNRFHRVILEDEGDAFRFQHRLILQQQCVARFFEYPIEFVFAQRAQLHTDGEPSLQLRNHVAGLAHVEGARGDEQHMVGANNTIAGVDVGALDADVDAGGDGDGQLADS